MHTSPTPQPGDSAPASASYHVSHDLVTRDPDSGDGIRVLRLTGEIDIDTVAPLRRALEEATADVLIRRTVLDLSKVVFADSSILNALLNARDCNQLILAGPIPHQLQHLFELTGTSQLFTFAPTVDAART